MILPSPASNSRPAQSPRLVVLFVVHKPTVYYEIGGLYLSTSVINRTPTWYVKYEYAHSMNTTIRLRNPTRYMMWTNSHSHHASRPVNLTRPKSAIARDRPIVARSPLLK